MNEQLLELLKLIVKRDRKAVSKIQNFRKTAQSGPEYIQFGFYKKGNWEESCDCWYVHEYFEYCSAGRIVQDLFNRIVDNIKNTYCLHTIGKPKECIASTAVRLIHVACAVNNKEVVQYLMHEGVLEFLVCTSFAGLSPAVVAVLKDSSDVIESVAAPLFLTDIGRRRNAAKGETMRWTRRDPDTKAVTKVTVEHFQDRSDQHPLVWCFFLNVVYSKDTLKLVAQYLKYQDAHVILGHVLHTADDKAASEVLLNFSQHVESYAVPDLLFQCVLWNRPESLRIAFKLTMKPKNLYFDADKPSYCGFSLCGIAEFLRHADCIRVLEAFNQRRSANRSLFGTAIDIDWWNLYPYVERRIRLLMQRGSPYTCLAVMYDSCKYSYNCACLCQCLSKVADNNYDVNEPGVDGLAVIQAVLLPYILEDMHCLENVFETLCQLGADVNLEDDKGCTALDIALTESPIESKYKTSSERLNVFKLVLSHNPNFNSTTITHAIERDRVNSLLQFTEDDTTRVVLASQGEKEIHAQTLRDKYLSLSFVAISLELGCAVTKYEIELFDKLPDALRRYLLDTLSMPQSLKAMCRNVVRKTFPGSKLDRLLTVDKVPRAIVDIIMFRPYLKHTKVTNMNGIERKCR